MELRQLRQFVMVAEHLNFRRAAEALHMAQPPLSVAIRNLEAELGAPLFVREGRGIALTEAGRAAYAAAKNCLFSAQEVFAAVNTVGTGEYGHIRLAFVGSATYSVLPALLPAFRQRFPGIQLTLSEATNLQALKQLEAGEIDAALVRYPTTHISALSYEILEEDRFIAAIQAGHPLAKRRRIPLELLVQYPFIDYSANQVPGLHALVSLAFQRAGLRPAVVQKATQVQTVISLVQSRMGVALVPSIVRKQAPKHVVFREVENLPEGHAMGVALAYSSEKTPIAVLRLREIAAEKYTALDADTQA
ncbi:LysR family transcriptional regulator [Comamonas sp. J-3]|uniref:LysR family transcriptional regulator n=1 Tax=Comamonas trifloxystrobinivorans TaxID=3350256 RepID=UPI0037284C13